MRKFLVTIVVLLAATLSFSGAPPDRLPTLTAPAEARSLQVIGGATPPPAPAGYACDSATDADVYCEDFMGSNNCNTGESYCRETEWTAGETSGTVVVGDIGSGNTCTDKGTRGVTISKTGSNEDVGLIWTDTSNRTHVYFSGMVRFISGGGANASELITFANSSWSSALTVKFFNNSGYSLQIGGSNGTTVMTAGTWYEISVDVTKNGAYTVKINGTNELTGTAANYDIYHISFGSYQTVTNYSLQWATIKVDDDAMPDACGS